MAKKTSAGEFTGFESEFEQLTKIVDQLEEGNIPLDRMLALYEEGTTLAAKLSDTLKHAELRVRALSKVHEELASFETEPFDEQE